MRAYTYVNFRSPQLLPDGTTASEFTVSADLTIRREPPDKWPAEVVVTGPFGEFRAPWEENVQTSSMSFVLGPGPHYSAVPHTQAAHFVEYLAASQDSEGLLFRGASDADYELLPKALRLYPPAFDKTPVTNREQIIQEVRAALNFYDAAHNQGLTIPRWAAVTDIMTGVRHGNEISVWPSDQISEFLAIAQHHGVPTRLLDWSLDPMVAAYFAAWDLCAKSDFVAVWVLNPLAEWNLSHPSAIGILTPIVIPYDVNRNAQAQRGVFTLGNVVMSNDDPTSREPFDHFLSRISAASTPDGIRKVTLPRTEVRELLKLLDRRRINGGTMFPGYDGAARAARELALWRDRRQPVCPG